MGGSGRVGGSGWGCGQKGEVGYDWSGGIGRNGMEGGWCRWVVQGMLGRMGWAGLGG